MTQEPTPVAHAPRRLDIQGLRAVAVLAVIAYHAGLPLPGGFTGVDIFFAISGFVITAMLMRQRVRYGRIRFGHFYFRRFLRLTPALALLVTVTAALAVLVQNPFGAQQTTARTGLGAMLLSANLVIGHATGDYFAADATTNPLLHTWSLSVEEQFYLVFPALLALGWWLVARGRRRAAVALVALVAFASLLASIAWSNGAGWPTALTDFFGGAQTWAFYSPLTRSWEFALGALLALLIHRLPSPAGSRGTIGGLLGAAGILASLAIINDAMAFPGWVAAVPVLATLLVIWAGSAGDSGAPVTRLLSTRPAVAVGDWSYSLYLWHWPLIVYVALLVPNSTTATVIAALLAVLPALLSYRFLERPMRALQPRSRPRAAAVIVATIAIPIAACLTLLVGANAGWGMVEPAPASQQAQASTSAAPGATTAPAPDADGEVTGGEGGTLRSQHAAVAAGCVNTGLDPVGCRFGPGDARGTILVAGDSQAYALADGVIAAGEQLGLDTVVTSHTGCPFLARESSGVHNYPCRDWQKSVLQYALDTHPAAVVIANRTAGYLHPEWGWRTAQTDAGDRAGTAGEAEAAWRSGIEPIVRKLSDAGIPVIVLGTVPEMKGFTDQTSVVSNLFGKATFEIPRDKAEKDVASAGAIDQQLAADFPGVAVVDPIPLLCGESACAASDGDTPIYQDETHLAVPGAERLTPGIVAALQP